MLTETDRLNSLEQELRRDLEAIERVKRMMAFKNNNPPAQRAEESKPSKIVGLFELDGADETMQPEEGVSLRGTIEAIMNADPSLRWTVQKMVQRLKDSGFELKAQKPVFSVGQAMKKLADKGRVRLAVKGVGSAPHVYQGFAKREEQ